MQKCLGQFRVQWLDLRSHLILERPQLVDGDGGIAPSIEAIAALRVAISGPLRDTSDWIAAASLSTSCAEVRTSIAMLFVAAAIPSLTTSETKLVPTGKVTIATMPVARGSAAPINQVYCNASRSGSNDREPSSTARAFVPFGESSSVLVAPASATGGCLCEEWLQYLSPFPNRCSRLRCMSPRRVRGLPRSHRWR
jgi:hypothetical protein